MWHGAILVAGVLLGVSAVARAQTPATPLPSNSSRPFEIEDNSFFVEEAFNQEAGVVQTIYGGWFLESSGWAMTVTQEWPDMEHQRATLSVVPGPLAAALKLAVGLPAQTPGQIVAQRDMASSLETAFDARRQRIIISESSVNWAKWVAVIALGVLTLFAIAFVHSGNRRTARIAIGLFAAAMAVSLVMIAVQDRPFSGPFRIKPTVLVQVDPGSTR